MRTRADRDAERVKWCQDMGLHLRHDCKVSNNTFLSRVLIYDWPKADGRQFDRDVIVLVYEDGSWATALDDGTIKLDDSKRVLLAMALAGENAKEEANADG